MPLSLRPVALHRGLGAERGAMFILGITCLHTKVHALLRRAALEAKPPHWRCICIRWLARLIFYISALSYSIAIRRRQTGCGKRDVERGARLCLPT